MRCTIHFYLLNAEFSQELADEKHNGQESEDNMRYEWEDELEITDPVDGIDIHEDATMPLQGEMPDGSAFIEEIDGMRLFECLSGSDQVAVVGCSESVLDSYNIEELDGQIILSVYLKDKEPMANPIPGLYIASQEFPKNLII